MLPPIQIYAQLLDADTYLCSISTMYRVLNENQQVKDRRRQARHPARAIPELIATGPGPVYSWDITKLAGPIKGKYFPKGTNLNLHSPERLAEVAAKINARPRESRDWESAQAHFDRLREIANI